MALEIENYLSLYGNERGYVDQLLVDLYFLIANQKFHQALNTYHLLFMVFIYQTLLKARVWRPRKFKGALIGFNHRELRRDEVLTTTSAFTFSKIQERSVMDYLAIFDVDSVCIGLCKEQVDERNDRSHANGVFLSDEILFNQATEQYDSIANSIQIKSSRHLARPISGFADIFPRGYALTKNDVELSLIQPNYLSSADLVCVRKSIRGMRGAIYRQLRVVIDNEF